MISAADAAREIREGRLSSQELVQNCLEREAADELVSLLNDQARRGDRVVLQ